MKRLKEEVAAIGKKEELQDQKLEHWKMYEFEWTDSQLDWLREP